MLTHAGRLLQVNIASISSYVAQPEFVPYNMSKAAILQLTRCCAMDAAPLKIRVNAICPGSIETEGSYAHMRLLGLEKEEGRKAFGEGNLLKRQVRDHTHDHHVRSRRLSQTLRRALTLDVRCTGRAGRDCERRALPCFGRGFVHDRSHACGGWRADVLGRV